LYLDKNHNKVKELIRKFNNNKFKLFSDTKTHYSEKVYGLVASKIYIIIKKNNIFK